MATTLYLRDAAETGVSVGSYNEKQLDTAIGSGVNVVATGIPTLGGNHIEVLTGGFATIWLYRVNAITISGTITCNICGEEDAMADNVQPAVRIVRVSNAGTILSDILANANANHADGVEWGTLPGRGSWTATPTSTAMSAGDWIGVIVHGDAIGTMAAGNAGDWCKYDGTAAGLSDSHVIFTENITEFTPSVDRNVGWQFQHVNDSVRRAANRFRSFREHRELWLPDRRIWVPRPS